MKHEKKYKCDPSECAHVDIDESEVEVISPWSITNPGHVEDDPDIGVPVEEHRTIVCPHCGTRLTQQRRVDGNSE